MTDTATAPKVETPAVPTLYKFFGVKEGQSRVDFVKETKALTPIDKVQLVEGINSGILTY